MGMSKDEFERIVKSIREVNQRGGYTTQGIILATLGSIFCCICTICVSHLKAVSAMWIFSFFLCKLHHEDCRDFCPFERDDVIVRSSSPI
jgi:hypothetical protein